MIISHDLLERTCKNMIETVLLCLENATRGTIYRIGPMPRLQAVRITSGEREADGSSIRWGLPECSDYNPPGKSWEEYRDRPGHILEAMGWCVEKQKSWTADDPFEDMRSVRKQLSGEIEDFHHMEPVLVRKMDVAGGLPDSSDYPVQWQGNPIWQDTDYVVVAVIKIHFVPQTIRRGDRSTKIIKKLSRTLGTGLLSLHLRETLANDQKALTEQRFHACNVLAHDVRNTLAKLSFIFSAINAEISFLREQWEARLFEAHPEMEDKKALLARLNCLIAERMQELNGEAELLVTSRELMAHQEQLAQMSLLPVQGESWIKHKIKRRWLRLLTKSHVWRDQEGEIQQLLDRLVKLMWIGLDEELAATVDQVPDDLKAAWMKIAYSNFSVERLTLLDEILVLLEHPALRIPHKQQTRKILTSLKALVAILPEMEERTNRVIFSLRRGFTGKTAG